MLILEKSLIFIKAVLCRRKIFSELLTCIQKIKPKTIKVQLLSDGVIFVISVEISN